MKTIDPNGYWRIPENPITKVGVFDYAGGREGMPDVNKIYKVYRPASSLNNEETINSFKGLPIVDEHVWLGDGGIPPDQKKIHGVIGDDVRFVEKNGEQYLVANLVIFTDELKKYILAGKRELSCGYRCKFIPKSGVTSRGEKYDIVQTDILGNHLALVHEGRSGSDVAIQDEKDSWKIIFDAKDIQMDETKEEIKEETKEEIQEKVESTEDQPNLEDRLAKLEEAVGKIAEFVAKLKPIEEEEHGSLDECKDEETEDEEKKEVAMDKKEIIREIARRDRLYTEVKAFTGVFDHAEMGLEEVAQYASRKLGLKTTDAQNLQSYISGLKAAQVKTSVALDSKKSAANLLEKYGRKS